MRSGTRSVVSGGRLILNSAFPRVLLPFASVISSTKQFLPTMLVYIPFHLASGRPVDFELLWMVPLTGIMIVLAAGLAMIVAALQVYFRDLKNIIPYALRLGLYVSPILYFAEEMPRVQVAAEREPDRPAARGVERRDHHRDLAVGDPARRGLRVGLRALHRRLPLLRLPGA